MSGDAAGQVADLLGSEGFRFVRVQEEIAYSKLQELLKRKHEVLETRLAYIHEECLAPLSVQGSNDRRHMTEDVEHIAYVQSEIWLLARVLFDISEKPDLNWCLHLLNITGIVCNDDRDDDQPVQSVFHKLEMAHGVHYLQPTGEPPDEYCTLWHTVQEYFTLICRLRERTDALTAHYAKEMQVLLTHLQRNRKEWSRVKEKHANAKTINWLCRTVSKLSAPVDSG